MAKFCSRAAREREQGRYGREQEGGQFAEHITAARPAHLSIFGVGPRIPQLCLRDVGDYSEPSEAEVQEVKMQQWVAPGT